ncbi:MAG: hypothetical protein D6757_07200 [Alphaproteobacteria bacterium]|nr:MAG: hypothetical protein D6757_07200 [Alphaproteobacteria bacterium]
MPGCDGEVQKPHLTVKRARRPDALPPHAGRALLACLTLLFVLLAVMVPLRAGRAAPALGMAEGAVAAVKRGASGLPLPRFVSLAAGRANMRVGPGRQYPIRWVYTRRHWPLKVIDEYGHWRLVEDADGTRGWMHAALLSGRRTALLRGRDRIALHARPDAGSSVRYRAEPGVLVDLLACRPLWCRVRILGGKAWVERRHLWGVLKGETFE